MRWRMPRVIEFFFRHSSRHSSQIVHALFERRKAPVQTSTPDARELSRMFAELRGLEEWGVRVIAGEWKPSPRRRLGAAVTIFR